MTNPDNRSNDGPAARRDRLFEWQATDDFVSLVDELDRRAGVSLITGRMQELREAIVLRDFALATKYPHCRLHPKKDEFPDAEVTNNAGVIRIEITIVMEEGRELDKEYKEFEKSGIKTQLIHVEREEIERNKRNWALWFVAAVEKKLTLYGNKIAYDIVVYDNIHLWEKDEDLPKLSSNVRTLMIKRKFDNHRVWRYRPDTVQQLYPDFTAFDVPNRKGRP